MAWPQLRRELVAGSALGMLVPGWPQPPPLSWLELPAVPCQTITACLIPSWPERPPPRRPRARELEARNAELTTELGGLEQALAHDMAALQADHELLRQQCGRWEAEARALCARHGEPLPLGLAA